MVEKDSAQRLWKVPIKGGEPTCIMKRVDSIGYHCWINKDSVALFILTNPSTLQITDINIQKPVVIAQNIGRCMQRVPSERYTGWERAWVFTEKNSNNELKLKSLYYAKKSKLKTAEWCSVCNMPPHVEDFAISKLGVFSAVGSRVFSLQDDSKKLWGEIFDLAVFDIGNITRLVVSPDGKKLAVVSNK